jgi:V/A-type H+-transporting ATPase subunit I
VYADKIWYPFWTNGAAGLTTAQNLQILCFSLALIQLTVAHIKGALRNKGSIKMLGDIGSILQLLGIYYLVLSLVVNAEVFNFGLIIGSIPVGTVAIALIGIGFVLSFVFSNYEGSIIKSILSSLTNIVSVLLGVVNVFSDIVSYIRLWAVGIAGAAISATVNELVSPLLGNFMFMIFAIVLLVFGHGLNMILNVLSVIVHGIRLNTLEFSSHLDMSWSGHKFKPFKE